MTKIKQSPLIKLHSLYPLSSCLHLERQRACSFRDATRVLSKILVYKTVSPKVFFLNFYFDYEIEVETFVITAETKLTNLIGELL